MIVGHAEDAGGGNAGMRFEYILHRARIDVEAAGDHNLLGAIDEAQETVRYADGSIARMPPPAAERFAGFHRLLEIAPPPTFPATPPITALPSRPLPPSCTPTTAHRISPPTPHH